MLVHAIVLFYFLFGRRAQRRPIGLIASTLIFSIFSFSFLFFFSFSFLFLFFFFFSFARTMNTHIRWYSFIPTDIPIFLCLIKIPIFLFGKAQFSFRIKFRYNSSFQLFNFSKHLILSSSLVNYGVSSSLSGSSSI